LSGRYLSGETLQRDPGAGQSRPDCCCGCDGGRGTSGYADGPGVDGRRGVVNGHDPPILGQSDYAGCDFGRIMQQGSWFLAGHQGPGRGVAAVGEQVCGGDVDEPPAEPAQVVVADLGADGDLPFGGPGTGVQQGGRITGVEAAGRVGAGDDIEQRVVITEPPAAVTLAEIGVEIDGGDV